MASENPPMLLHALALAARGWALVALHGKHPYAGSRWRDEATSDETRLRGVWKRHPKADVGIATGRASMLWVLDVDGAIGRASLRELIAAHGSLPRTFVVATGNGLHYYWLHPEAPTRIRNKVGKTLRPGLDVRGEGGYVVGPGSTHVATGNVYRIVVDAPLAPAPSWLVELVRVRDVAPDASAERAAPPPPSGELDALQLAALESAMERIHRAKRPSGSPNEGNYEPGERNATLNREVHGLARTGAPRAIVEPALKGAAREVGLEEPAIARTFESAWQAGLRAPPLKRRAPERRRGRA